MSSNVTDHKYAHLILPFIDANSPNLTLVSATAAVDSTNVASPQDKGKGKSTAVADESMEEEDDEEEEEMLLLSAQVAAGIVVFGAEEARRLRA